MKWTKKVAFYFIEEAVLNAYLLNKKSDNRKCYLKLKLDAISALLAAGGTDIAAPTATDRLSQRHFPEVIPPTPMKQFNTKGTIPIYHHIGVPMSGLTQPELK